MTDHPSSAHPSGRRNVPPGCLDGPIGSTMPAGSSPAPAPSNTTPRAKAIPPDHIQPGGKL